MTQSMDLESEQFMTLLTEALRAGPGSPEWHQAVGILKSVGAAGGKAVDEYQLLVKAREDLESGRDYRAVTPGAGFTRKVMQEIEEEGKTGKSSGLPSANLIALLASGVILAVVVVIAVALFRNAPPPPDRSAIERLQALYFVNPVAQLNFENGAELTQEWRRLGEVPLNIKRERLSPATTQATKNDKREYKAGAIVLAESIAPDQPRMVDVTLKVNRPNDAIIPEVFVAEGPLDDGRASSGRELVWLLKGTQGQVALPDGSVPGPGEKLDAHKAVTLSVKLRFNKDTVIVESGEKRLYEGPHKLSESAPRYVGIRFRRKVGDTSDGVGVASIIVLKP